MKRLSDLPVWIWLWLAAAPLAVQLAIWAYDRGGAFYLSVFDGEHGVTENLTVLMIIPAIIISLFSVHLLWRRGLRLAAVFVTIFAAGCLVLAGEEASWGQHVFQWGSPDYFKTHNKQAETNFHNLKAFNKSLFKWLTYSCAAFGGALVPVWAMARGILYKPAASWIVWLIPTRVCIPATLFVFVAHVFVKSLGKFGAKNLLEAINFSVHEIAELYLAIFLTLYAVSLYRRLVAARGVPESDLIIGP